MREQLLEECMMVLNKTSEEYCGLWSQGRGKYNFHRRQQQKQQFPVLVVIKSPIIRGRNRNINQSINQNLFIKHNKNNSS